MTLDKLLKPKENDGHITLMTKTFFSDIALLTKRRFYKKPNSYDEMTSKERILILSQKEPFYFETEEDFQKYYKQNNSFPLGLCFIKKTDGTYLSYNDIPIYLEGEQNPLIKQTINKGIKFSYDLNPQY